MALGISSTGGGDFLPICKWNASAGRFIRVDRAQGVNGWETTDVDLTMDKPKFAVDMGSIEVGFVAFLPTGPDFHMVPLGSAMPPKPSKDYKTGFRVKLAGNALKGVREFSSSAKSVVSSLDTLHTAFEAAPEAAAGKIPVVELSGSTTVITNGPQGKVTSYSPTFTIVTWIDRMPEMGDRTVPAPGAKAAAPATQTTAAPTGHVPPPAHVATPAPAAVATPPANMPF